MGTSLRYFFFMLWLSYLIVTAILLFTKGFLLTRIVQKDYSTCVPYYNISCPSTQSLLNSSLNPEDHCQQDEKVLSILQDINIVSSICLPQKARVILLIVDALRYDFAVYDEQNRNPLPFQNKLPIIHRHLYEYPESTRLYKFLADPPTTTMQRLKALTTGSLPTFIDAGSNFATYEIDEDNIIDQLIQNNRSVVFMGDDTWNGLYPNRFLRNYPYPSFNVWDLDTVDHGVIKHLFSEIEKSDWSLLIGHFLGVDHCGHRYGPNHPEMTRKLGEINQAIEHVIEQMNNDTMLFVIGDHGMTVTGDHGGESLDEITAAMFVYSKQALSTLEKKVDAIKQVDLVPTLSAILGVPIPFQNLGTIVLNSIPIYNKTNYFQEWQLHLHSLWSNLQQMIQYIGSYAETTDSFADEHLASYYESYTSLENKLRNVRSEEEFQDFSSIAVEFMVTLRTMCEEKWIQFDSFSMARGLLFLFYPIFSVYLITDGIPSKVLPEIFKSSFLLCSYSILIEAAAITIVLYYFQFVINLQASVYFATSIASQVMLSMVIIQNWEVISLNLYDKTRKNRKSNLICRLVMVLNLCGLFSNSYIIEESYVLLYLLVTVILAGSISIYNFSSSKRKNDSFSLNSTKIRLILLAFVVAALIRSSMYFWRCREEQQWCFSSPDEVNYIVSKFEATKLEWAVSVLCLAIFVFLSKEWLRQCGNLNGYGAVVFAKHIPVILLVSTASYWVLRRLPVDQKHTKLNSANTLAWTVYSLTFIGIICTVIRPLCVYVISTKEELTVEPSVNVIPQLFNKMKERFKSKEENTERAPIVCGLATVYSSVYIIIGIYLTILFSLLLGDGAAPSAVIMILTASFVLVITSVIRIDKATSVEQLYEVPHMSVLVWVILSQYFFYGSGHQAAFPNISWEAAFVGTSGVFTYNIIPGTLIIINTFCSYILMGFWLPLIIITPFTISVMLPSLVNKKNDVLKSFICQQGELRLYQREDLVLSSLLSTSCKYIICHGLRVFASMLAATIHCRHLMVWRIFAPKLIFESIGMFITLASVICGFLLFLRINKKVDVLLNHLIKSQ